MFYNNDKATGSLDILFGLEDNDVYGLKSIQKIQKYDKYLTRNYLTSGENRPDLLSSSNKFGYLLFANPSQSSWGIGDLYGYYSDEVILRAKADGILEGM